MNRFEKAAYGGDDEYGEYDRWSDGGPAWGLNKQKMIDMTRLFATEAARRKAQLQFHSDRYGADMYSPEEAVKRISAVANDKDLDDVDNLPNYYNLQYPLKPRSGILETLRLKSPGPIDDWGPEGHPMEAVNRALMGMRSRSGSLKKAAYVGREDYNGEYDRHGEYDRWYDDEGPALGLSKKKMIDMTRLFAAEAAKHKAQLRFHSDPFNEGGGFSPEEAVRRIEAASRPERIDYEESPNYYSLQYPPKPRSGILETLRLKSPAPIDWGPDGHPKEVVNRAIMGMRSGSLKKAAAFGAMMGKRAAYATPSNFSANDRHIDLDGPNPVPDDPTQGFARFAPINKPPAAGTFPGNSGPSMGVPDPVGAPRAKGILQQWMTPPTGTPAPSRLKQFMKQPENPPRTMGSPPHPNSIEAMRRASWTPEQHQENRMYEAHRISEAQEKEKQDYRAQTPDWEYRRGGPKYGQDAPPNLAPQHNHAITPDNAAMVGLASMGTGFAAGGLTNVVGGGGGLGGGFSDATALAKSFIPKGEGTAKYLTGIGKASLPYTDPTGLGKSLIAGAEGATGTTLVSRGLTAAMEAAKYKALSEAKGLAREGGPQTPAWAYGENRFNRTASPTPGTRTVGEPQAAPGTNTVGEPQTRPMAGTIPNVPRG